MYMAVMMRGKTKRSTETGSPRKGGIRRQITSSLLNILGLKQLRDIRVEVHKKAVWAEKDAQGRGEDFGSISVLWQYIKINKIMSTV